MEVGWEGGCEGASQGCCVVAVSESVSVSVAVAIAVSVGGRGMSGRSPQERGKTCEREEDNQRRHRKEGG